MNKDSPTLPNLCTLTIQAKHCAIVYLDVAKHVPWLAIALRQRGLKSCSNHGKNMSSHDKAQSSGKLADW